MSKARDGVVKAEIRINKVDETLDLAKPVIMGLSISKIFAHEFGEVLNKAGAQCVPSNNRDDLKYDVPFASMAKLNAFLSHVAPWNLPFDSSCGPEQIKLKAKKIFNEVGKLQDLDTPRKGRS